MLDVTFDDGKQFSLPCEYLRVFSPSAEVRGHGLGERRGKGLVAVRERLDEHRQVHAGDPFHAAGLEEPRRDVRRRGAVDVAHHEHARALVQEADEVFAHAHHGVGVVVHGDADLAHVHGPLAEHVARRVDERFSEGAVGDNEDADH